MTEEYHEKPICYDLYAGLGGWADGFLAEGYRVIGFDIEAHDYGTGGYPGELRIRDVCSIHGSELRDATCIVGSSPCQEFSYRAMPWKRAKALPPPYLGMELFNAQFRIQREASEAAGHHIPMVVENVRGAQKWVGRAQWHYGSFYLWGDVPALMPMTLAIKGSLVSHNRLTPNTGVKVPGIKLSDVGFNVAAAPRFRAEHGKQNDNGAGTKVSGDWFGSYAEQKAAGTISPGRLYGKNSNSRKAASAMIAKIPAPLALHIARCFKPEA